MKKHSEHNYRFALTLLLILLVFPGLANAANWHVRSGATGSNNGSNWSDAWTTLPGTLARGDTYYIADGSYGGYTFNDSESGSTYVFIKKATGSDHGTATGWSSDYGDGVATFNGTLEFDTGYYDLDGVTGGGPGNWDSGHGFLIDHDGSEEGIDVFTSPSNPVVGVRIRHFEIRGSGPDDAGGGNDGISLAFNSGCGSSRHNDWLIEYSYIWYQGRVNIFSRCVSDVTLQYSKLFYNESYPAEHAEAISHVLGDDWVIRYNWFEDADGTGFVINERADGWEYYGNVFLISAAYPRPGQSIDIDQGVITDWTSDPSDYSNFKIYNNTIVDLHTPSNDNMGFEARNTASGGYSGVTAYNNLCYGNPDFVISSRFTSDYNWFYGCGSQNEPNGQYGLGDPFTDIFNHDFTLRAPTDAGIITSFNVDMVCMPRGADDVFDRGAFEFNNEFSFDIIPPMPPTNLNVF